MNLKIILGILISFVSIFLVLSIADFIIPYFDPRYILLILLVLLGIFMIAFGISIMKDQSFGENILEIIINFRFSALFPILFGCLLILIALFGFIYGPDWLGMEVLIHLNKS